MSKCPFCPLMLPGNPEMWEEVGSDYHGERRCTIGGVRACEPCEAVIREEDVPDYIAQVAERAEAAYQEMRARMAVYIHYVQAHLEARHA